MTTDAQTPAKKKRGRKFGFQGRKTGSQWMRGKGYLPLSYVATALGIERLTVHRMIARGKIVGLVDGALMYVFIEAVAHWASAPEFEGKYDAGVADLRLQLKDPA